MLFYLLLVLIAPSVIFRAAGGQSEEATFGEPCPEKSVYFLREFGLSLLIELLLGLGVFLVEEIEQVSF